MNCKAVLIDIDNTLLDFNKSSEKAIITLAESYEIILPENFLSVFLDVNDGLWNELQQGIITKQDIYDRRWKTIFQKLNIECDFNAFEEDYRKALRSICVEIPYAREILIYLSSKYPVYTASNASRFQQNERLRSIGFDKYISGMFTSEEIGFQKPHKEFFYSCAKELYPIKPQETVMIGDNINADIIGAKNFGMKSIWFNYEQKDFSSYSFTDYYVNSLDEIKNIL